MRRAKLRAHLSPERRPSPFQGCGHRGAFFGDRQILPSPDPELRQHGQQVYPHGRQAVDGFLLVRRVACFDQDPSVHEADEPICKDVRGDTLLRLQERLEATLAREHQVPDQQEGPPVAKELIRKTLPNAFAGTNLHALIQETGRRELILAGCMTHVCVSTTARAAKELGYRNTVVARACATRDLQDPFGEVISADVVQRAALSELKDGFSIVVADASAWAS